RMLAAEPEVLVLSTCTDPQAAVTEIRQTRPDVLFLDVRMPELDGFGVLEALHGEGPGAVVFTTAFDDFALEAFEVAAIDYLLKPFTVDRLRRALDRVRLRRGTALPAEITRLLSSLARTTDPAGYLVRLPVPVSGRIVLQDVNDVSWLEADGKYVKLHM